MKFIGKTTLVVSAFPMFLLAAAAIASTQVTGVSGSPSATTTIDGKQIRPPAPNMTESETFDLGLDTRLGVDDFEYQVPFRFNGAINKLTYKLGPEQLSADDKATGAKTPAVARD